MITDIGFQVVMILLISKLNIGCVYTLSHFTAL